MFQNANLQMAELEPCDIKVEPIEPPPGNYIKFTDIITNISASIGEHILPQELTGLEEILEVTFETPDGDQNVSMQQLKFHQELKEDKSSRNRLQSIELHVCEICSAQFKSVESFNTHLETHGGQYACETCGESFKKIVEYTLHVYLHSEDKVYKCPLCDYTSEAKGRMIAHLDGFHEMKTRFQCQICGKRFNVSSWFKEHKNFHTGERPFKCMYCGKRFPYTRYLNSHISTIHKPSDIKCSVCGKEYKHKNNLKLHMLSHNGKQPICDVCGKQLTTPEKLKLHMRLHTGDKPYGCLYCTRTFPSKPRLTEHTRIHTGERPYACRFCSKRFTQRSSKTIHERCHTGERPFGCHLCSKGFTSRSQLNIHLKFCDGVP